MTPKELVKEREASYGRSSEITNEILQIMDLDKTFSEWKYPLETVMILSKLIRALHSPSNLDHWVDIQGYAQLVIDQIEADQAFKGILAIKERIQWTTRNETE